MPFYQFIAPAAGRLANDYSGASTPLKAWSKCSIEKVGGYVFFSHCKAKVGGEIKKKLRGEIKKKLL
jgi:hypothetical protein